MSLVSTTDPSYMRPLKCKILYGTRDTINPANLLYNPFTDGGAVGKAVYCTVSLSKNHWGIFYIEIENSDLTWGPSNLYPHKTIKIEASKTDSNYTTLLNGIIQEAGYTRGRGQKTLYYISGFGRGIRLNERITDYNLPTPVQAFDGQTEDFTNTAFAADSLLATAINSNFALPLSGFNTGFAQTENTLGWIIGTGIIPVSNVETIIPGIVQRYQEINDIANTIEDYAEARAYVDTGGWVRLEYDLNPVSQINGFVLKVRDSATVANDLAANTGYFRGDWTFSDSYKKESGWQNSMYAILPEEGVNTPDESLYTGSYNNLNSKWAAQKFTPKMNRIFTGDFQVLLDHQYVGGGTASGTWAVRFSIWRDNGQPFNMITQFEQNLFSVPASASDPQEKQWESLVIPHLMHTGIPVEPDQSHWLVMQSVGATSTLQTNWYHNNGSTATSATSTNGGSSWSVDTTGPLMAFTYSRSHSQPYRILDQNAFSSNHMLVESTVPSIPQSVNSRQSLIRWMVKQMKAKGRPYRQYQSNSVTMPSTPILPGDLLMIQDAKLGLSQPGSQINIAFAGDMQYEFGGRGGSPGPNSTGMRSLTINPIAYMTQF